MRLSKDSVWYHGSPHRLTRLFKNSTITQDYHLAEVFSHRPTIVSVEDDGRIRHNGDLLGYLYIIDEPLDSSDIEPVPHSTMEPGKEFLTRKELTVRLINKVAISLEEMLNPEEISQLQHQIKSERSTQ